MIYTNDSFLGNCNHPELSLGSNCGYTINEKQIQINIDKIYNNREISNISGSLSVELWALAEVYNGKYFSNAYCMANIMIGEISGQHFLENCQYNLPFTNPPSGTWQLCLMLREYNGEAYETIDYCNFNIPYFVDNIIAIEPKCINELEIYKSNDEKIEKKITKTSTKKTASKDSKVVEKIDLNTAKEEEITKIKGISWKLASLIFSSRPFKSSDDLMKIKGIGKKLLDTILEQAKI